MFHELLFALLSFVPRVLHILPELVVREPFRRVYGPVRTLACMLQDLFGKLEWRTWVCRDVRERPLMILVQPLDVRIRASRPRSTAEVSNAA